MKAVYPGSFDPVTNGHLDVIRRASPMFEELTVLIASSSAKTYMFSTEERVNLVAESLKDLKNVRVQSYGGLTTAFMKENDSRFIVRGLRAVSDFDYEFAMANMNHQTSSEVETVLIFARPEFSFLASRMIKEVAVFGGDISHLVPAHVDEAIRKRISK